MENCIFCKIIEGKISSEKVFESKEVISFMDINPANKGHTLVVTKEHYENFNDIPDNLLSALTLASKKVSTAVEKATKADGYNILINSKKASGQEVPHAHFHIIPRFLNDGVFQPWPHKKYEANEMHQFSQKIKTFL